MNGKVAEDQITEVITFEPSMNIDLTFPTNTLFFYPTICDHVWDTGRGLHSDVNR